VPSWRVRVALEKVVLPIEEIWAKWTFSGHARRRAQAKVAERGMLTGA